MDNKCINDPKANRSKGPSPTGRGYCAHAENEGKVMKGSDGKKWVVKLVEYESGKKIKRWFRSPKPITKKTPGVTKAIKATKATKATKAIKAINKTRGISKKTTINKKQSDSEGSEDDDEWFK